MHLFTEAIKGSLRRSPDTITKTRLYNADPHQPHFYIAKLGFIGVYVNFLISAQKQIVGTHEAVLTSTHNLCFEQKFEKNTRIFI